MTRERFEEILEKESYDYTSKKRIFTGIQIIQKYIPNEDICAAEHDMVYCCDVDELIKAGVSEEDVKQLAKLGWIISDDALAHFA